MVGLPCVNCGQEVSPDEAKIFEQVFVCPECHAIAERLSARAEQTLTLMRGLLRTCLRQAILKQELQFHDRSFEDKPVIDFVGELAKMVQAVRMEEAKERGGCPPSSTSTSSTETTKPNASTADGPPSSD